MTVRLGMFTMPFHHPAREYTALYYHFFIHSFSKGRKALFMLKPDRDMPDEAVTLDAVKRALVIAGSPRRVLEQLVALREEVGHFGTLLMSGQDWDQPKLWRRSMELLATEVMPAFSRNADATPAEAVRSRSAKRKARP